MRSLLAILALVAACSGYRSYPGSQVWRLTVETEEQVKVLDKLQSTSSLDFWTEARLGKVDVMVKDGEARILSKVMAAVDIKHELHIPDVDDLVSQSKNWISKGRRAGAKHAMDWTSYHPVEDMHDYMQYLVDTYDFVSMVSIGQSYEGNDMKVLQVCKGGCGNKPAMWVDGGIHAREWVSPAVVTFMMKELIENEANHPDLTQNLDWYILPSVNPDGYAYSHSSERLWRKTRSKNSGSCYGTDANRNWGYYWNTGGTSTDPCSDIYHGSEAFSEIENRNIRDFLLEKKDTVKFFNTIHSYSQLILLPWGFTFDLPDNYYDLLNLANEGADELYAAHGEYYEIGCIPCLLYVASGGSLDWALGVAGIPYSYGMELRDTGRYGFLLPPEQIIPTGEETWAFHQAVAREIAKEFGGAMN